MANQKLSGKKEHFSGETAGHRMTRRVPVAQAEQLAGEVYQAIQEAIPKYNEIHFVYVTDEVNRLLGILSLRELLRIHPETPVGNAIHRRGLHAVHPHSDQEKAANLALTHNLRVVPVIDEQHHFLGTLTEDVILSILHKELREDILHLGGVFTPKDGLDTVLEIPYGRAVKHRLPWLFLGLFGGIVTAHFIGFFEKTLNKDIILAFFIPLIVYMSSAVGTQMQAFVIRDFALVRSLEFRRYFFKECFIVLMLALIISGSVVVAGFFLRWDLNLILVLGLSLSVTILSSIFTGIIIPYFFRKLGQDPANASGPVATIIQDFLSVAIYLGIASLVMGL